jgi:hypothetical protein
LLHPEVLHIRFGLSEQEACSVRRWNSVISEVVRRIVMCGVGVGVAEAVVMEAGFVIESLAF